MERVFSLHSPRIAKIELVRTGKVRRAKLYYLRGAQGKAAKVKEKIGKKGAKVAKHLQPTENLVDETPIVDQAGEHPSQMDQE